jgi:hypothetical protein
MTTMSTFRALAAILVLACGLAGCGAFTSTATTSTATTSTAATSTATTSTVPAAPRSAPPGVIAWVDRPASQVSPAMTAPSYTTGARPCTPADLTVTPGENGPAAGVVHFQVLFTNRSATKCWLNGHPTSVAGVASDGTVTPLPVVHGGPAMDGAPSADIAPGQSAELGLAAGDGCAAIMSGRHRVFAALQFGLPGSAPGTTTGTVTGSGDGFDTECGVWVSEFGVPGDIPAGPPPSPLTAAITSPAAARAGTTLSYQVTLANPTAAPFSLDPCPSYVEYLGGSGGNVSRYFYLNCAAASSIPAHGSVTFEMELAIPASMQPMTGAKLDWQVQGGTGPAQASILAVK